MKSLSFSTPLVPKVLDRTKDVTRRVCKPQPIASITGEVNPATIELANLAARSMLGKPPFHPGELFYVKEAWFDNYPDAGFPNERLLCARPGVFEGEPRIYYKADPLPDFDGEEHGIPWKSPRFMPEWASRGKGVIVSCTPQRLQEITFEDANREGFATVEAFLEYWDVLHPKAPYRAADNPFAWRIEWYLSEDR